MFTRRFCLYAIAIALVGFAPVQGAVVTDHFEQPHDFVADGVAGTIWDGFLGLDAGETVTALNASMDRPGQLYVESADAFWHEPWTPLGPFLYKMVEGDFIATVKVTDYAGTAAAPVYHNNGGLMARALPDDAGPGEDWVALDYFPIWSCGNFVRTANDGVRTENGHNGKQFDLDPYLQIERIGNVFHFRTSTDGVTWTDMAVSPITRDDLADVPVQVGVYQATYSSDAGYLAFDEFTLEGPLVVPLMKSYNPTPADGAADVERDTVLGWLVPEGVAAQDVYFGTSAEDVAAADRVNPLGVLVAEGQSDTTFVPAEGLEYGQTYYWRVDVVEADGVTTHAGDLWSFTAEPYAYPIANVVATSNAASEAETGPENTVNGSGLDGLGRHSTEPTDMWLGEPVDEPVWIQFEFDTSYKLHEMRVWNYNVMFEKLLGLGLKDVTVEYSTNGTDWTTLGDVQLNQATARADYTHNTTVDLGGAIARFVRLTVNSGYSTRGQYGLSEVRFFYKPVVARGPQPANQATNVAPDAMLRWRPGREAVSHEVYFDTSMTAVVSGASPANAVTESRYAPGELNLGTTYYWKVNEVNEAADPSVWEGNLWSFSTLEFFIVDDFESYTDDIDAGRAIFDTWLDGWVNETGSTVGYLNSPFAERTIVHGGRQSMPLQYDNASAPWKSEAERAWSTPQDWTRNGIDTLRLFFRGPSPEEGQAGNAPDGLYVAIHDNNGQSAIVKHPDPQATLIDAWQQWQIPLSPFSAAGVALNRVAKMVIGIGDPDNPSAGGEGLVFIDTISVGHPLSSMPMVTEIESFDNSRDFLTEGTDGTFWDGFLGLGDNETVDALNASLDRPGQLFIQSTGAFFHEPWSPIGPFLYKVVEGNFIATVKVAEYAGTAEEPVYHNTCGLMARALPDEAGPGEDWVSLDYFPIWNCGNFVRSANDDARTENGHNGKAFAADRYLQIERIGNVFHFRTSPDGASWTEMAVSPLTRDDLEGLALQVGLFQATYSDNLGYAAFDDFILETP
ncbi:discoidin domain-containing protein [Anaerobaca lacustris]|uniref:Discoidin domain-containing protein n=1 Tax=Anaerobaca lacustris TaxID=3044600 RepID=A0AAW6U0U1_9BACT|nr:discoidin domain-containing protein [Sedimentisphaerales bacterium M17dextr]